MKRGKLQWTDVNSMMGFAGVQQVIDGWMLRLIDALTLQVIDVLTHRVTDVWKDALMRYCPCYNYLAPYCR